MISIMTAKAVSTTGMIPRPDALLEHGGDLGAARQLFPEAPQPFIDLSTGFSPDSSPVPPLSRDVFSQLPHSAAQWRLSAIAAQAYGAPSAAHVVCAPGSQILLPLVAGLASPGRAVILGPTYSEHARAAAHAGHAVLDAREGNELHGADLAIVVNPNNPDGRIISKEKLLSLRHQLNVRRGLLVVDEAFMFAVPPDASLTGGTGHGKVVVSRSLGKFSGLPGLGQGFGVVRP